MGEQMLYREIHALRAKLIELEGAIDSIRYDLKQPKPKWKKRTFYREAGGFSRFYRGTQNPIDTSSLDAARDYCKDNPGSILEIVVRKPVK